MIITKSEGISNLNSYQNEENKKYKEKHSEMKTERLLKGIQKEILRRRVKYS